MKLESDPKILMLGNAATSILTISESNMGEESDFDDEAEVKRRLPKLFALMEQ